MRRIRILLDQNTRLGLRRFLTEHEVVPAGSLGWAIIENGALIRAAEDAGCLILITCDPNIRYQQNLTGRPYRADNLNLVGHSHPARSRSAAVQSAAPGTYSTVTFPRPAGAAERHR